MATGSTAPILELERLTKVYGPALSLGRGGSDEVVALDRVSLRVDRGEIFGIVGESGSGKTTLGRMVVRLEDPQEGHIRIDGRAIEGARGSELKRLRKKVQMIFQDPYQSLNPYIKVLHTIAEPLAVHGLGSRTERNENVAEILNSVGLSPPDSFVDRYPHQLSGGERQRVAIARALVLDPEIVIADEPTSMLDASIAAQILAILRDMRTRHRIALIFITHNLAAARYLCDRIAVLYRGRIVELGPAERVIQNPAHPYTQALLDAIPGSGKRSEPYGTLLRQERTGISGGGCPFFPRCKRANEVRCSQDAPALEEAEPGHTVACFYAGSTSPITLKRD